MTWINYLKHLLMTYHIDIQITLDNKPVAFKQGLFFVNTKSIKVIVTLDLKAPLSSLDGKGNRNLKLVANNCPSRQSPTCPAILDIFLGKKLIHVMVVRMSG